MAVDGVADHLGDELVDQNDADIAPGQEAPEGGGGIVSVSTV